MTESGPVVVDDPFIRPKNYITPLHENIRMSGTGGPVRFNSRISTVAHRSGANYAPSPITAPEESHTVVDFYVENHDLDLTRATGVFGDEIEIETFNYTFGVPQIQVTELEDSQLEIQLVDPQDMDFNQVPIPNRMLYIEGAEDNIVRTNSAGKVIITPTENEVRIFFPGTTLRRMSIEEWEELRNELDNGQDVWNSYYQPKEKIYTVQENDGIDTSLDIPGLGPASDSLTTILLMAGFLSLFAWLFRRR
jgi:hypothetical protein